jgi:hypothetical protein
VRKTPMNSEQIELCRSQAVTLQPRKLMTP